MKLGNKIEKIHGVNEDSYTLKRKFADGAVGTMPPCSSRPTEADCQTLAPTDSTTPQDARIRYNMRVRMISSRMRAGFTIRSFDHAFREFFRLEQPCTCK